MKIIGMIGGLSWESSVEYYRIVNETAAARLGGLHSADVLMYSFDFAEIEALQHQGRWDDATARMIEAAGRLERGGADLLIICSNTMHRMADEVQAAVSIPLLHIADPTAAQIKARGLTTIGLLGTRYTMEQDFYKGRLTARHGLNVLVPDADDRAEVNRIIYEELVLGRIEPASKAAYVQVIEKLVAQGAQGIILGCTEIMLLIGQDDCRVPVFDTTRLHAEAAVEMALEGVRVGKLMVMQLFLEQEVVATDVTFAEYLERYAEDRCEWIDGMVVRMSPIVNQHEDIRDYLRDMFRAYFRFNPIARLRGEPFVMKLPTAKRGREPDLFVIMNDNPHPYYPTHLDGPADICIEIVSPGTESVDHGAKFKEYEFGGVREYWILDYIRRKARFYRLDEDGVYMPFHEDQDGNYTTPLLPKFKLHVPTFWDRYCRTL